MHERYFSNSEARAWLIVTNCVGFRVNGAQIGLESFLQFKPETPKNMASLLVGGHLSPDFWYFLGREDNSISLPRRGKWETCFCLIFHRLPKVKEWKIRLAGTGHSYPAPSSRSMHALHLILHIANTLGQELVCQAQDYSLVYGLNLRGGKQLGNLITASSLNQTYFQPRSQYSFLLPHCLSDLECRGRKRMINHQISTNAYFSVLSMSPWLMTLLTSQCHQEECRSLSSSDPRGWVLLLTRFVTLG